MSDQRKKLANGEKLWFSLFGGFVTFSVAALICTNPFLSAETMKWLFLVSIPTYPIGCIIGWRFAEPINNWMGF